jgi:hypothetical protein
MIVVGRIRTSTSISRIHPIEPMRRLVHVTLIIMIGWLLYLVSIPILPVVLLLPIQQLVLRNDLPVVTYRWTFIPFISVILTNASTNHPVISCFAFTKQQQCNRHSLQIKSFVNVQWQQQHPLTQQTRLISSFDDTLLPLPSFTSLRKTQMILYDVRPSNNVNNNINHNIEYNEKFGWKQRLASIQCFIVGAITGSISQAPISLLHNVVTNNENVIGQWEYDTDMAAIIGGLFAILYRYIIRTDINNPQLNQGCISSMILIRTLPQIRIPSYCTSVPLNCHHPPLYFYIFDYNILQQLIWCGFESAVLFTATATIMDMAMDKGYIIRFPG